MRSLVLALPFLALCITGAQAQQCGPLKRALSLDLSPGPAGGPLMGVGVTVNGTPRNFLLNTGGQISRVTRAVVIQQGLSPRSQGKMLNFDGTMSNGYVVTVDLGVGSAMLKSNEMLVDESLGRFDGQFAPDLMQHYDIDFDFAGRKLSYFLSDHCDGQVVYWPNSGITAVTFRGWIEHNRYPEITIPVSLDGHEVLATINTGLANTEVEADTVLQNFKLTIDSPGAVPMGARDNNPSHRSFGYTFKTLAIGGLKISDPRLIVSPDLVGTKGTDTIRADSHVVRYTDNYLPAVRLGMDVLRRLHFYIAAKEGKVYVTLAADQAQGAPARTPAAATTPRENATSGGL